MRDTWAIVGTRNNNLFAYYMVQSITINTSGGGGWGGGYIGLLLLMGTNFSSFGKQCN